MLVKIQASEDRKTWWMLDNLAKVRFRTEAESISEGADVEGMDINLLFCETDRTYTVNGR